MVQENQTEPTHEQLFAERRDLLLLGCTLNFAEETLIERYSENRIKEFQEEEEREFQKWLEKNL